MRRPRPRPHQCQRSNRTVDRRLKPDINARVAAFPHSYQSDVVEDHLARRLQARQTPLTTKDRIAFDQSDRVAVGSNRSPPHSNSRPAEGFTRQEIQYSRERRAQHISLHGMQGRISSRRPSRVLLTKCGSAIWARTQADHVRHAIPDDFVGVLRCSDMALRLDSGVGDRLLQRPREGGPKHRRIQRGTDELIEIKVAAGGIVDQSPLVVIRRRLTASPRPRATRELADSC